MRGSCLCGAVELELRAPVQSVGNCHCSMCRRVHGTPFSTYAQLPADTLLFTAAEHVRTYASSPSVDRTFCDTCGANLTFRVHEIPELVWVAAGILDDDPSLRPDHHIFVASKASWWHILDKLPQHEDYPPISGSDEAEG